MKQIAAIDFACNDPDNGLFNGRAGSAMYGDVEIEAPVWEGYRFGETGTTPNLAIRLHRLSFPVQDKRDWVGNWCWNRYFLCRADMKRLLLCMRRNGWRVSCGPSHFYHWWNDGTLA